MPQKPPPRDERITVATGVWLDGLVVLAVGGRHGWP